MSTVLITKDTEAPEQQGVILATGFPLSLGTGREFTQVELSQDSDLEGNEMTLGDNQAGSVVPILQVNPPYPGMWGPQCPLLPE